MQALLKDIESKKGGFKRSLGVFNLTTIGIGAIVGAGLFVLSGEAAATYAGPAVAISFVIAAFISLLAALSYAEFASMIPIAGSAYTYTYVTLGEFAAWTMGWMLTLEFLFSASTVAVGWSGYLTSILHDFEITLPSILTSAPVAYDVAKGWAMTGSFINLPAVLVMAGMGYLIYVGTKAAARFNDVLVIIKIAVILVFICVGIAFIKPGNLTPFIPQNTGVFGQFGWSGILRGTGLAFFAYIGFDAVSTMAQEARNPKRDLTLGMLNSLGISAVIHVIVAVVLTGVVIYTALGVTDPVAVAMNAFGSKFIWLRYVLKIAILVGLTSVVLVMTMAQTRINYAMAHDGLLPKSLGKIHKKHHTPHVTTVYVTFLGAVVAGIFPAAIIGELVSIGTLFIFGTVSLAVLILRYKQPHLKRPFKVPLMPFIPALGVLLCYGQMFLLPWVTWVQWIVWFVLGAFLYYIYGRRNSIVRNVIEE